MNIQKMLQQAQKMQTEMAEKLGQLEATGQSGGGMVTIQMTGKGDVKSVKIDPSVVDPEDVEMLEDLMVAALNDAKGRIDEEIKSETEKMMGGMGLPPGMKLPF